MGVWAVWAGAVDASEERTIDSTPYKIGVFVFFEAETPFPADSKKSFSDAVSDRCRLAVGLFWDVSVNFPDETATAFRRRQTASPEDWEPSFDKVFSVVFDRNGDRFRVREFDVKTRWSGPEQSRLVDHPSKTADALVETLLELFTPIARLEKGSRETAFFRVYGVDLFFPEAFHSTGAAVNRRALLVFVRNLDREGKTIQVSQIPWTSLVVEEFDFLSKLLRCRVETGLRDPLGARRRGRTEIYALSVPAPMTATTLRFLPRNSDVPDAPAEAVGTLPVYDVFETLPGETNPQPIGRTRTDGTFVLEPVEDRPVRNILIKSGRSILARLPVVRGLETECRVFVPDDPIRLNAEAALHGIQEEMIDVAARRSILNARIKALEEKNDEQALRAARNELSRLKSAERFRLDLDQAQRRFRSTDPMVQRRIDGMFEETRQAIPGR